MLLLRRFRRKRAVSDPVTIVSRFVDAANRHDADAIAKCLHPDFESIQPIYPSRNFRGATQVKRNWQAIFESEPGFRLSLVRSAANEGTVWVELHGAGRDVEVAGVFIMGVEDELVRWARVYSAVVEQPAPKMADHAAESAVVDDAPDPQAEAEELRRLIDAGRASADDTVSAAAEIGADADRAPAVETEPDAADSDDEGDSDDEDDDEGDDDEYEDDDEDDDDSEDDEDSDEDDDDSDEDDEDGGTEPVGAADEAALAPDIADAADETAFFETESDFWQEPEVHDMVGSRRRRRHRDHTDGDLDVDDALVVDLTERTGEAGDDHDADDPTHGRAGRRRGGRRRR